MKTIPWVEVRYFIEDRKLPEGKAIAHELDILKVHAHNRGWNWNAVPVWKRLREYQPDGKFREWVERYK